MDKKNVVFKCYSSGDSENDVLYVNGLDINRITPKLGKDNYVKLMPNFV